MKNNKIIFGVFLLLVTLTFSCQKDNAPQIPKVEIDYNEIGVIHNQGLEYAFESLKAVHSKGVSSKEEYFNIIGESTVTFTEERFSDLSPEQMNKVKTTILDARKSLSELTHSFKKGDPELYTEIIESADTLMTENQKKFSDELFRLLLNKTSSIKVIQNGLDSLENVIELTCSEIEKQILLSAISIARHSSNYWNDNYLKWENELNPSKSLNLEADPVNWKVVGAADVAYAVTVGIACSTALLVPFIGWTTYIGVVGGGAIICSGMTAIAYLLM
jgi:hypothetical protein